MPKLKRMLLIAPTEMNRTAAFDRAQALASSMGALLHIVAFDCAQAMAVAGLLDQHTISDARERYIKLHRRWLEQQAALQRSLGLQVSTEVVSTKSTPANVLEYINDFHADLVIKDVQHVPALDRAFYRPLDWLLLRDCTAHLHLVTEGRNPKPLKILAAIDLSHLEHLTEGLNDQMLELAYTLACSCDAALHLLNVSKWSVLGDATVSVLTSTLKASLGDAVNDAQAEAFEVLAERYAISQKRRHLMAGIPHKTITHFAKNHAFDMLVVGAIYQRGPDQFIGGNAEGVLNRAPCSLFIVKPTTGFNEGEGAHVS